MFYRVTQSQIAATGRNSLAKQTSELYTVQQRISSGLKIQRPADDPTGMRRGLIQRDRIERLELHESTIQHVRSRLDQAHVQLRSVNDLLTKAREIAMQAPQITDDSERRILANELSGLLEQLGKIANSSDDSGYLFSGTEANTEPFPDLSTSGGQSTYRGTSVATLLHHAGDVDMQALLPGDIVFQPVSREATVLIGSTGAKIGSGIDSATGMREAIVSHRLTTYAAGAGIIPGSSSVAGDTIIGPSGTHRIQINDTSGTGTAGTVSLNGGPPVSFSSMDSNLLITGANGERVYVNTTAITAGFNGAIDITADGSVSIDEGLTLTAISFSSNQVFADGRDGTTVNLDTSSIMQAGTIIWSFPERPTCSMC